MPFLADNDIKNFNPRPPRGGRLCWPTTSCVLPYFNPRPPRGGRRLVAIPYSAISRFQSTPPARGATNTIRQHSKGRRFQSTPPARGATFALHHTTAVDSISIHAPREGGDLISQTLEPEIGHFNPRPPRGGRLDPLSTMRRDGLFQSTPPARGATFSRYKFPHLLMISIHAPREGGDPSRWCISIHAPREGGDRCGVFAVVRISDFNPRPPRGGRLHVQRPDARSTQFQSTPPARGATQAAGAYQRQSGDFNPRPPRGGRLCQEVPEGKGDDFNPRPPRGGRHSNMSLFPLSL